MKDSDGNIIGSALDKSIGKSSGWTAGRVDLNYSDITHKAANIYILFKSSSSSSPGYESKSITVADDKSYSECNIGSILYLDNIELIYE